MTYVADILPAWNEALRLIKAHGYVHRDKPFKLASGQLVATITSMANLPSTRVRGFASSARR